MYILPQAGWIRSLQAPPGSSPGGVCVVWGSRTIPEAGNALPSLVPGGQCWGTAPLVPVLLPSGCCCKKVLLSASFPLPWLLIHSPLVQGQSPSSSMGCLSLPRPSPSGAGGAGMTTAPYKNLTPSTAGTCEPREIHQELSGAGAVPVLSHCCPSALELHPARRDTAGRDFCRNGLSRGCSREHSAFVLSRL